MPVDTDLRPVADDELLIEREFEAPLALVFRLWAERARMMTWWGPRDFVCTHLDFPLRPGAKWRARIDSEQHGKFWQGGEIREVEPESRIVFSFAWEEENSEPGLETLVTVTFEERDGRTVQHFHQAPFASAQSRDGHIGGWAECFDREEAVLDRLARETGQ